MPPKFKQNEKKLETTLMQHKTLTVNNLKIQMVFFDMIGLFMISAVYVIPPSSLSHLTTIANLT